MRHWRSPPAFNITGLGVTGHDALDLACGLMTGTGDFLADCGNNGPIALAGGDFVL